MCNLGHIFFSWQEQLNSELTSRLEEVEDQCKVQGEQLVEKQVRLEEFAAKLKVGKTWLYQFLREIDRLLYSSKVCLMVLAYVFSILYK